MRATKSGSIEGKVERLRELEAKTSPPALEEYNRRFEMSWIHHDSAIEGIVYEPSELAAALSDAPVTDAALLPTYDEIRQFRSAIQLVRQLAAPQQIDKSAPIPIDQALIQKIYVTLAPDEPDAKFRKDIPLHRLYFHEIAPPDKIASKIEALIEWLASEDPARTMHTTRIASRAHYMFLQAYPYPKHSGKVGRLLMNLMLLREGYPPAVLHATDRQRYYDALRTSADATAAIIQEALDNSLDSAIRYFQRNRGM